MTDEERQQEFPGSWGLHTDNALLVRIIRLEAAIIRRRIAKRPVKKKSGLKGRQHFEIKRLISKRHARLTHAKKIARAHLIKQRGNRVLSRSELGTNFTYRSSTILDHISPNRKAAFRTSAIQRKLRKGDVHIEFKNMSFTHNPKETMKRIGQLADHEADAFGIYLDFHDTYCLDVGPYLLLSLIKKAMPPMFIGGDISLAMSKVLSALELDQELGIAVPLGEAKHKDVFPFPVHRRRQSGSSESETRYLDGQSHEKVAGNLQVAIDEWLGITTKQKLNARGRRNVLRLVTETLDNAERHGDLTANPDDGDWIVAGFMARRQEGDGPEYFRCHLAFLSTGTTISDTINTTPDPTKTKMAEYVASHKRAIGSRSHSEDHLRTIFALQDGVTRSEIATKEKRNGTGLQDILEFYSDLAAAGAEQADASLAIVSGNTCVLCNGPYMHGIRQQGDDSEREMWFNRPNSKSMPPDNSNLIELDRCLKGTLISMAFTLDLEYLERTVDSAH